MNNDDDYIEAYDGDNFLGWLFGPNIKMAGKPFRPYGSPPAFDLDEYKDSFEIWEAQWEIFLELSTINTVLLEADRPKYKANILKSCLSKSTLTALPFPKKKSLL